MKKFFLLPLLTMLFFCLHAASVSVETAQTIAVNFFKVTNPNCGHTNVTATLNYTRVEGDNTVDFYVFDMAPLHGFVIVAGNTSTKPVIAYSTETNFNLNVPHAIGINYWMNHVAARIHNCVTLNVQPNALITNLWNAYLQGQNPNPQRDGSVNPLLTTTWDQEPYYNDLCPYNATNQDKAVTGCVATAMAQIMKYWQYPAHGTGSYSYNDAPPAFTNNYGTQSANFDTSFDWALMPASINSSNNAVARLMYDCGVSVAMDYGDDSQGGSGAWVLQTEVGPGQPCAQYAYVNYFYYNPNTIQGIIKSNFTGNDWIYLLENELNNNRVVQYEGDDINGAGGHTWVCDGYDANDNLHMNWGWSGQDDGYFAVANLDAGEYNFDDNEAALIGIEPISPVNVTAVAQNQAVCPGGTTTLTAHGPGNATFSWMPTEGLSCPTCATTTVSPNSTYIYTVTADSSGVKGSASIAITITRPAIADFNFNTTTSSCAVPASITFNNLSQNATSYLWNFGDGFTSTATNPVHVYNSFGSYSVWLTSFNNCGSGSKVLYDAVKINDLAPVIAGQSICAGNSVSLVATGAGIISWYGATTGVTLLDTGLTYTTPVLDSSTFYYASSYIAPAANTAGPVDNTLGSGGYFTSTNEHGLFFNCTIQQVLNTVDVYAETAGERTIFLKDSNGDILASDTINIPAGPSTITLNFSLPAENNLKLATGGDIDLYRNNSGATYPYVSSDGTIQITNSDAGTPGYYYFFYNWKLQQPGCTTNITIVPVNVLNANSSFYAAISGATVYFMTVPGVTSCTWDFGDSTTSNQLGLWHSYPGNGTYTVVLIESNGGCTDTVTRVITIGATGINQLENINLLSLFPDPAHDVLNVSINTGSGGTGWKLVACDILGQAVLEKEIQLQAGDNTIALDISALSSGVHILSLQNGNSVVTRRFVKVN